MPAPALPAAFAYRPPAHLKRPRRLIARFFRPLRKETILGHVLTLFKPLRRRWQPRRPLWRGLIRGLRRTRSAAPVKPATFVYRAPKHLQRRRRLMPRVFRPRHFIILRKIVTLFRPLRRLRIKRRRMILPAHRYAFIAQPIPSLGPVALMLIAAEAGNLPILGCYTVPESDIYDLGYEGTLNLSETWAASGALASSNILALASFLAQTDVLDQAASASIISWVEINIGVPSANGIAWGGWQKFVPGSYPGQYAWRRAWVQAPSAQIQGSLIAFNDTCSVPARIDHYQNLSVPSGGLKITFEPDGASGTAPFNYGPDGAALPFVMVTFSAQSGDVLSITSLSLASVTIQILNGGSGVARSGVNVSVEGY